MPCHTNLLHINQNLCHSISPLLLGSVENQYCTCQVLWHTTVCSVACLNPKKKTQESSESCLAFDMLGYMFLVYFNIFTLDNRILGELAWSFNMRVKKHCLRM